MKSKNTELDWKSIPKGGVCWKESIEYFTGDWRSSRPIIDKDKCSRCLICWIFCPDIAIDWDGEEVVINYDFCKGCGICSKECPVDAIKMIGE